MKHLYLPSFSHIFVRRRGLSFAISLLLLCLCMQPAFGAEGDVIHGLSIRESRSFPRQQTLDLPHTERQQIHKLMRTKKGGVYKETVLKQDFETILRYYQHIGFPFVHISTESVKKIGDGVHIRIHIDKGIISDIKLNVQGYQKTDTDVILRELLFKVGDVYMEDDAEESEHILRQKEYISAAKVTAHWDAETKTVKINVTITEDWLTITGAISPALGSQSSKFLLKIRESNLNGTGHGTQFHYERISEIDEKTRSLFKWGYQMPRLFNSHWNFNGEYIQKRVGDSWGVLLELPQYTLKSRWSVAFSAAEAIDEVSWYEEGMRTGTYIQDLQHASSNVQRYFGDRHRQNYIGVWTTGQRSIYTPTGKSSAAVACPTNRTINRVGFTVGRQSVNYHQTRFLRQMGREEDFFRGSRYEASLGYASPLYGSDSSEAYAAIAFKSGWVGHPRFLGTTTLALSTNFTDEIEHSTFQARTAWFYTDIFNTGDIYKVNEGFRRNGLFDFHQTLVAQIKTQMLFGWSGQRQVILGAFNGLRGYGYREFSGEKMLLLSIESRTIFGGELFQKLDEISDSAINFCVRPFSKHNVNLGLVLGATVFADIGYIWKDLRTFNLNEPKRSVGIKLRGSFSQVSAAGIFHIGIAFPLDPLFNQPLRPQLLYGLEQAF